ncbi:type I methionyl aminopeptidase [Candidatus Falkowbacteria bacterium]|nr:type I methionyl aminopeptidase [Candidatus Falkowbacteria bacterium]
MISKKTKEEIKILKEGGKKLGSIMKRLVREVKPGVSTEDLEKLACELIKKADGRPAFKNFEIFSGEYFPTALCTSVNNEIVHKPAIPGRVLNEGDIIGIDIGMEYPIKKKKKIENRYSRFGGFYTDMAKTIAVGDIDRHTKKLLSATKESLEIAIRKAKPGNTLNDIGKSIQKHVESKGFSVVRDLVGHGVGHKVHEDPQVFNYDFLKEGIKDVVLEPGMVIAIEPMVNVGSPATKSGPDGFSVVTADGSLSAHFEHTIAIVDKGNIVITS